MYPYFISGQCSLFIPEYRSKESEHQPEIDSGTFFFLVQILKNLLYTWGWLANSIDFASQMREESVSKIEKIGFVFYAIAYFFYCKRVSVFLLDFSQYGVYDFTHEKAWINCIF